MTDGMSAPERDALWRKVLSLPSYAGATGFLGWELIDLDVERGICEVHFHGREEMMNPGGNMQGGFITAMLDDAMSVAACIVQPVYGMAPTLQMTTNFLRPVPMEKLRARGEVVRAGRSAVHTKGELFNMEGKLLATGVAACMPRPVPLPAGL